MNVLQFLTDQTTLPWMQFQESDTKDVKLFKGVVERLNGVEGKKVCIVFDDFEKSNFSFDTYSKKKICYCESEAGYLVYNSLKGWFQNGLKLIILNPWQYFRLHRMKDLKPIDMMFLLGIDYDAQKTLFCGSQANGICNRNRCKIGEACFGIQCRTDECPIDECFTDKCPICKYCHRSNCHLEIQSLCYVPCNCKLMVEQHSKFQLTSPVVVASVLLLLKLSDIFDSYQKCRLGKIGEFAWKHYIRKKFMFYESDLRVSDLNESEISVFFTCKQEDRSNKWVIRPDVVFFFSHVLLQELLSALWLLSLDPSSFRNETNFFSSNGTSLVVHEFMSQICTSQFLEKWRNNNFWKVNPENLDALRNLSSNGH